MTATIRKHGLLCLALALVISSGCATSVRRTPYNSFTAGGYPPAALETVVSDMAAQLAATYPPGRVSLFIGREDGLAEAFGTALEDKLRLKGFTMATDDLYANITVAYVFDRLDNVSWYSRLSASDGLLVTKVWRETKGGGLVGEPSVRRRP